MEAIRTPTREEKEEFDKIDSRLDKIKQGNREKFKEEAKKAHVELRNKIFMKISDVEPNDARKFKDFCDRHFDGKQFIGIKYMMALVDKLEPLSVGLQNQINNVSNVLWMLDRKILEHEERLIELESTPKEEKKLIPKTQGKKGGKDE